MRSMSVAALLVLPLLMSGCATVLQGTKLAPVAVIEVIPQQGHTPFEVNLSAVPSSTIYGEITTYEWDFGDGGNSDEVIVKHTFDRPGTYVVSLTVINSLGVPNSTRATVVVTRPPGPDAPGGMTAQAESTGRIDLSWTDRAGNEAGFQIWRRDPDGVLEELALVDPNTTTFTDTKGLKPETRYCYAVKAFNSEAESDFSNEACATTLSGPPPGETSENMAENDFVIAIRTIEPAGDNFRVTVIVEAKVELELAAVVEDIEGVNLADGELTTFAANMSAGETFSLSYVVRDDEGDGGSITGTVRAKAPGQESVTLNFTSTVAR